MIDTYSKFATKFQVRRQIYYLKFTPESENFVNFFIFVKASFDLRTSYDLFETKIRHKWFYETGPWTAISLLKKTCN